MHRLGASNKKARQKKPPCKPRCCGETDYYRPIDNMSYCNTIERKKKGSEQKQERFL
jgi:hypothetical protein